MPDLVGWAASAVLLATPAVQVAVVAAFAIVCSSFGIVTAGKSSAIIVVIAWVELFVPSV